MTGETGSAWRRADALVLLGLSVMALALRLWRLGDPSSQVFDETYYAKDACWYATGSESLCDAEGEQTTVHPPLGKWILGAGVRLFGFDSFGWRIGAAIAGAATVTVLFVFARRLLRSTVAAGLAAGLLAIDPLHFVQSRIAMLDIFVPLFGIAAVACIVTDRDRAPAGPPARAGPGLLGRPWRIAAGACAGATAASKWSGFYFVALVVVLALAWAVAARRDEPARAVPRALRDEGPSVLLWLVLLPIVVYALTYLGRLDGAFLAAPWSEGAWARAVWDQQFSMWEFHRSLTATHPYQSPPWSWPLIKRPVAYFFTTTEGGDYQEILAMGSPLVWWASLGAMVFVAYGWVRRRGINRPEDIILAGFVFTYGPWLVLASGRPAVFLFYLLPSVPFMCLALGYVVTRIGRSWEAKTAVAVFALAATGFFVFFSPLLVKRPLPYSEWDRRIWFDDCPRPEGEDEGPTDGWCWI